MLNTQEIKLILDDLNELYQYDFNFYSKDSFTRRINKLYSIEKYKSFSDLRYKLRTNRGYADHFVDHITVNVTSMFRDEKFFIELRTKVIPQLLDLPLIKVWNAGCSTGEEAYSIAILLKEAGVLEKSEIYASDVNPRVIETAKRSVFPVSLMQVYAKNYLLSGGTKNFSDYFSSVSLGEKFNEELRSRIHFIQHSLANDLYLQSFDLILCRNVLIYFDRSLQEKALKLFDLSLRPNSFLALGEKETLSLSQISKNYTPIGTEKIWRKVN